jgi:hypothetical protein
MSEQTKEPASQNQAPRNPFAGTGIAVIGIVRHFASQQGKDGKLYHDLFLTTSANPDLKISLPALSSAHRPRSWFASRHGRRKVAQA